MDPSVNAIIIQLKKELDEVKKKKEELQNELSATKFNPDRCIYFFSILKKENCLAFYICSQLSKRLMLKCKKLLEENEELGRMISSDNLAQLEHELAFHKQLLNEACENEQSI